MLGNSHPVAEVLDGIITAGQRAADLTRQMLAYAGKGRFVVRSVDLNKLVREISGFAQASFSKKVTLTLSLDDQLPLVQGDPGQIQQVLMNLIINAAEAIGDNPGLVSVRTFKGSAEASDQEDQLRGDPVCIEVSDTGCGMDAETQSKIFDPFFTTKFAGRGLGLAGVAGIVRGHKGTIRVESAPKRGTRFTVAFPASEGTAPETLSPTRAAAATAAGRAAPGAGY
jgi:signal transduction histidine kinase